MASIGFAVGLGNIWRFPYVTGENGGAAFVAVYLICAFAIGVPILIAEILIGRRGRSSPPDSMGKVALLEGRSGRWQLVGHLNLMAAFVIEVVYCVIAGWVLLYLFKAIVGGFAGVDPAGAEAQFAAVLEGTGVMLFWTLVGQAITGLIVYAGVKDGIERAVRILMPTLFGLLVLLAIYNAFAGGFSEALVYLFSADFSKVNGTMVLAAIGQAFFSIGVAMAGMMTFGAYLPKEISISRSVVIIIVADTVVALMAGLVIFPAVFHYGLNPAGGPGLIFQTLPVAFAQMPGGHMVSVLFFLLLAVAAITSMVGLIEPQTAWMEERFGLPRHKSAPTVVGIIAVLSILSILSYNVLSEWRIAGRDLNNALDDLSTKIILPIGGFLIALFVGWFVTKASARDELKIKSEVVFEVWHFLIRYVVPLAVFAIFIVGVLS